MGLTFIDRPSFVMAFGGFFWTPQKTQCHTGALVNPGPYAAAQAGILSRRLRHD
jgi:hypothetical protein